MTDIPAGPCPSTCGGMREPVFFTMSRRAIEAVQENDAFVGPAIAICLAYPTGRLHRVFCGGALLDVLHLRFHDVDADGVARFPGHDPMAPPKGKGVPMTAADAEKIVAFFNEWKDKVETVYIACYGGVSRSRGIKRALQRLAGQEPEPAGERMSNNDPNPHCEELVLRAGGLR